MSIKSIDKNILKTNIPHHINQNVLKSSIVAIALGILAVNSKKIFESSDTSFGKTKLFSLVTSVAAVVAICYVVKSFFATDKSKIVDQKPSIESKPFPSQRVVFPVIVPEKQNVLSKKIREKSDPLSNENVVGVYLTTNEKGVEAIYQTLVDKPKVEQSCHIGFSGLHNFNIIAIRRSSFGIILDFNPANKFFIEKSLDIVRRCPNRKDFVKNLSKYLNELEMLNSKKARLIANHLPSDNLPPYFYVSENVSLIDEMYKSASNNNDITTYNFELELEMQRANGWLSSDENYHFIRQLALSDKIVAITSDIRDSDRLSQVTKLLQDNFLEIDTLYVSNIRGYIYANDQEKFINSIKIISQENTSIIGADCSFLENLVQTIHAKSDYLEDSSKYFNNRM